MDDVGHGGGGGWDKGERGVLKFRMCACVDTTQ